MRLGLVWWSLAGFTHKGPEAQIVRWPVWGQWQSQYMNPLNSLLYYHHDGQDGHSLPFTFSNPVAYPNSSLERKPIEAGWMTGPLWSEQSMGIGCRVRLMLTTRPYTTTCTWDSWRRGSYEPSQKNKRMGGLSRTEQKPKASHST